MGGGKDPVQKFGAQYGIRNQEPAKTNGGHLQAASPGKIPGSAGASLNFSQVFKFVRTKYVHNKHRRRYVMTSFTLDPLHSEISWVRGLFSELPRFFGDRSDLFAPQRQSSCTLTRSREPTL